MAADQINVSIINLCVDHFLMSTDLKRKWSFSFQLIWSYVWAGNSFARILSGVKVDWKVVNSIEKMMKKSINQTALSHNMNCDKCVYTYAKWKHNKMEARQKKTSQNIHKRSQMSCDQWIGTKQFHKSTGTYNNNYFEYLYNVHTGVLAILTFIFILFISDAVSFVCVPTKLSSNESRFSHCELTRDACTWSDVCVISFLISCLVVTAFFFLYSFSIYLSHLNFAVKIMRYQIKREIILTYINICTP